MKKVITIDGPAGSGKSTVSKALAERLNYLYLDTGALYRALAYKAVKDLVNIKDSDQLRKLCSETEVSLQQSAAQMNVFVDGEDVSGKIRTEEVGLAASTISSYPVVREKLLAIQRETGLRGGVVAEGRDMGSVVFPQADFKFFLDANIEERVRRRHAELVHKQGDADREAVYRDMKTRDAQDSQREIAPLEPAPDSVVIDSTFLNSSEVIDKILSYISED